MGLRLLGFGVYNLYYCFGACLELYGSTGFVAPGSSEPGGRTRFQKSRDSERGFRGLGVWGKQKVRSFVDFAALGRLSIGKSSIFDLFAMAGAQDAGFGRVGLRNV